MLNTIIIGAGPSGSYMAEKLTQLGHKVMVLEKKAAAGHDVCCTGIIGKECRELLTINDNLIMRQVNSAKFFMPSGKSFRLWRDDEVAYIVERASLDMELASRAQSVGAEYRFSTQVTDIELDTNCVRVKTNGNSKASFLEAETVVIATGYGSTLTGNLDLGKIHDYIIGAQAEVCIYDVDEVEIYLDHKLAPGGFAWLVPTKDGRGFAGLITSRQQEWHLNQLLSMLKSHGKILSDHTDNGYGVIPLSILPKTYSDRILVVGEAAGQIKPTTGGGIYYGILCANMAANVLHSAHMAGDYTAAKLSSYQKQWRAELGRELTVDHLAQRLWAKLNNRHIEYIFSTAYKKGIPRLISTTSTFSFDWHSPILLQIAYSLLPFANPKKRL